MLNNIVGHNEQLFVVRRIGIKNTVPEPPAKLADGGLPPAAPTAAPAPAGAPAAPTDPAAAPAPAPAPPAENPAALAPPAKRQGSLEYKFGTEKIEATLEIEILDFAEPEALQEKGGSRKPK